MENLTKIPGFDKLYQSLYSKNISLPEVTVNPLTTVAKSKTPAAAKLFLGSLGLLTVCYGFHYFFIEEKDN